MSENSSALEFLSKADRQTAVAVHVSLFELAIVNLFPDLTAGNCMGFS
jgi:hypothetical protein